MYYDLCSLNFLTVSLFLCNSLHPLSLLQYDVNGDGKPGGGGEYEVQVLMVCSYLHIQIHKSAFGAGHSASETFNLWRN